MRWTFYHRTFDRYLALQPLATQIITVCALATVGFVATGSGIAAWVAGSSHPVSSQTQRTSDANLIAETRSVRGTLRVSAYSQADKTEQPLRHESVFANGRAYHGMEDNDLRGFLDGGFLHGWNQPGQIHVRVGRRGKNPVFGEYELFRILQRWDDLELPSHAHVVQGKLRLMVEQGPPFKLSILLYEVKKDWQPGAGGKARDNTSPPQNGDVWWNDVAYQRQAWALPGAGFASDVHAGTDTAAMPMAAARYRPGSTTLTFTSAALTHYISTRLQQQQPLLFLLKLADHQEDYPGSLLSLYSGNHGDNRNVQRRPHLLLEWESAAESQHMTQNVWLEYGRSHLIPRMRTEGAQFFAVSFAPTPGYAAPVLEVRGGKTDEDIPWHRVVGPLRADWNWLDVRLTAVIDPIVLGEAFTAELRDTWVRTQPPEQQDVLWTFTSPLGQSYSVRAAYQGDYQWRVRFHPPELGRWRYVCGCSILSRSRIRALRARLMWWQEIGTTSDNNSARCTSGFVTQTSQPPLRVVKHLPSRFSNLSAPPCRERPQKVSPLRQAMTCACSFMMCASSWATNRFLNRHL